MTSLQITCTIFFILGQWNYPVIIGQCMPPTSSCTFEQINNSRAILFGGMINDGTLENPEVANSVYIIDISVDGVVSFAILIL